jgi:N-acetyl-anhydromuramyl-L-alanine amidase AmpD
MKRALLTVLTFVFAAAGMIVLGTDYSLAQASPDAAQCEQIRQAVAQYGYEAARRHAIANYGKQAVEAGQKCLTRRDRARKG